MIGKTDYLAAAEAAASATLEAAEAAASTTAEAAASAEAAISEAAGAMTAAAGAATSSAFLPQAVKAATANREANRIDVFILVLRIVKRQCITGNFLKPRKSHCNFRGSAEQDAENLERFPRLASHCNRPALSESESECRCGKRFARTLRQGIKSLPDAQRIERLQGQCAASTGRIKQPHRQWRRQQGCHNPAAGQG